MRCFQGQTILQVAQNKGKTSVLVPDIKKTDDLENLLKPTFDERTAKRLGRKTIGFFKPAGVAVETDIYQYESEHYNENSCFLIDDNGFLVGYVFAQSANKIWEIHLE